MSEGLTFETFRQHLQAPFQVEHGNGHLIDVALVDAKEVRAPRGYEAFSLLFRGPLDGFLPQASYRFTHGALGAFDIFIVPIRDDAQGYYYEAVFNRERAEESV